MSSANAIPIASYATELDKLLDLRKIHLALIGGTSPAAYGNCGYGKEIIHAVIAAAAKGVGPDNAPYPAYEPWYEAMKRKASGPARWLKGMERTGPGQYANRGRWGGMLDGSRFRFEVDQKTLWLVWTAENDRMAIYAEVHQEGLPLGRGGPSKKRTWLHIACEGSMAATVKAYQLAIDDMIAAWNAGRL